MILLATQIRIKSAQFATKSTRKPMKSLLCLAMKDISSTLPASRVGFRAITVAPCAESQLLKQLSMNREKRSSLIKPDLNDQILI
jgi:hypothetical protein